MLFKTDHKNPSFHFFFKLAPSFNWALIWTLAPIRNVSPQIVRLLGLGICLSSGRLIGNQPNSVHNTPA